MPSRYSAMPTPIPRSKRQLFHPTGNTEATPKASNSVSATVLVASANLPGGSSGQVEPLSIKKKNSVRSSTVNSSPLARKINPRSSPLNRPASNRIVSPRRISPQIKKTKPTLQSSTLSVKTETLEHLSQLAVSTREDVCIYLPGFYPETHDTFR